MNKQWKPIEGYVDYYEISNYGEVESLGREIENAGANGGKCFIKGRTMKIGRDLKGYNLVGLTRDGVRESKRVAHLVWDAFGDKPRDGHKLQVDHIDSDKNNNFIGNLQLLTNRENCAKGKLGHRKTSKYTGVHYNKNLGKWQTTIQVDGKSKHLGYFDSETRASKRYSEELCYIQ